MMATKSRRFAGVVHRGDKRPGLKERDGTSSVVSQSFWIDLGSLGLAFAGRFAVLGDGGCRR